MFVVTRFKSYISNLFTKSSRDVTPVEVGLIDVYLEEIFRTLSWKDPRVTLHAFCVSNVLTLSVLTLNIKFYGILSLITLFVFIYDLKWRERMCMDYKGEYACLIKDIKNGAFKCTDVLQTLRKDSPMMFTASMGVFFLILRMISSSMSGISLFMVLLFLSFFIPKGFQMLPEDITANMRQSFKNLSTPKCILAEDELIPFIQGKDFSKREADLDSLLTDRTADSITNSLVSGIVAMPSYLEVAGTSNDIEEEDLIPSSARHGKALKGEFSSDSDSDHKDILFDSDHFNTSSSEEDRYTKDLAFAQDITDNLVEREGLGNMISNFITTGRGNIVANIFQSAMKKENTASRVNSDSDNSDFEIIDYVSDEDRN